MIQTVILGPHIDLHPGYHGSMIADPPDGIFYYRRGGRHRFLFSGEAPAGTPRRVFEEPHAAEMIDFGPGPQVVHSPRWPVVGRGAWIADMDDFGFPVLLGRFLFNPSIEGLGVRHWRSALREVVKRRAATMLRAYAHPSCRAVLFWTRHARDEAAAWIERLGLAEEGRPFSDKSTVVYPAQRSALPEVVEDKWRHADGPKVLFVGGDYEAKNGRLALELFRRLAPDHPEARFTYVGAVPGSASQGTDQFDFRGPLPRSEVLSLFRESHILFHPAREESFGMVFAEAAANGLAVVAARGAGMAHVDELFDDSHGVFVDRDALRPEEEPEAFEQALRGLLSKTAQTEARGRATYRAATQGHLSLGQRNRRLADLYRAAADHTGEEGLSFPIGGAEGLQELTTTSAELSRAQKDFLDANGIIRRNFYAEPPRRIRDASSVA